MSMFKLFFIVFVVPASAIVYFLLLLEFGWYSLLFIAAGAIAIFLDNRYFKPKQNPSLNNF
ncbi:MAG: hypothetical protein RL154_1592 [Pseudomonadota bacterium]